MLKSIQAILKAKSDAAAKEACLKFVPGSSKIYGVRMPELNKIAQQFKTGGFELVEALWKAGAYEERMLAAKILGRIAKKDPDAALQLVKKFSGDIDNWALCDTIGMQSLKPIVQTRQEQIFTLAKKYNRSTNMWERRLSLVLVEYYTRDKNLLPAILQLVATLEGDKEYYIKKAIVWINKNITKGK